MQPKTIRALDTILAGYIGRKLPQVKNVQVGNVVRSTAGASRSQWFFDVSWDGEAPVAKRLTLRASECTCFREDDSSIEREYRIFKGLEGSPIPVPTNYWYEDDPTWLGEPFVIREFIDAQASFATERDETKRRILDHFIELLAAQHCMDWRAFGLGFLGAPDPPEDCALRLLEKWDATVQRDRLEPTPLMTAAAVWLKRNLPRSVDRIVLCQGQVGPGQILYSGDRVVASLDWESAFLGDPMADIAYLEFILRPTMGDYTDVLLRRYEKLSGLTIRPENVRFYSVFGSYWVSAICISGRRSVATGEMRKLQALNVGLAVPLSFMRRIARVIAS